MTDTPERPATLSGNMKRPSATMVRRVINRLEQAVGADRSTPEALAALSKTTSTPWLIQQFLDGAVDLEAELFERYPNAPLLSVAKFRSLSDNSTHKIAYLSAQDEDASLHIDLDPARNLAHFTFTLGGMMSYRYILDNPEGIDRPRWLDLMERRQAGLTFLWSESRWQSDYLIWVVRRYSTHIFAFSPNGSSAAVRITPESTREVLGWLNKQWNPQGSMVNRW
ncbi:MAG: hypothetical protein MUF38_19425 [Anaerolineae bacterium]|jgi:hypothetical protein|nr:hypothetical protein [Anaerolineae bacterium]